MLTGLDDTPWHQIASTFDHAGTSDPRFFDRLWFAAYHRSGSGALQLTMGVYQNMNVADGGVVVIDGHTQHNLRVSRQLRPDYEQVCGPLRIEVVEPLRHLRLVVEPNPSGVSGSLDWVGIHPPQEEGQHFRRKRGRVLEDYCRYDQIGRCSGRLAVAGAEVAVDDWWACRDHSWGVRERVGIDEPVTGVDPARGAAGFVFLFYSGGHVQMDCGADGWGHLDATCGDDEILGCSLDAIFVDDGRPRRVDRVAFDCATAAGRPVRITATRQGPAIAMPGLGYGGYDDGRGLGVWRGSSALEAEAWDVSHPAVVVRPDGTSDRPAHRIQPVAVTVERDGVVEAGTGSLTFIAEVPVDSDGHLRAKVGPHG
jgi:hypothetical protein